MDGRRVQFRANLFQHLYALFPIITKDLDFDQLMRFQADVDFAQYLFGKTIVAYHHNRVEIVAKSTQVAGLFGIQFNHRSRF